MNETLEETMSFTNTDKLKALAITNIFETSRPFGNFAAVAINDDGAGISYGINQFTHRSGSLLAVAREYIERGGTVGKGEIETKLSVLKNQTPASIEKLAVDNKFKKALRAAASTNEMRDAQIAVAEKLYLKPAIDACIGSGFIEPLTLAVVYDSINHGSFEKIGNRVPNSGSEKAWVTNYILVRDQWLRSTPRLKKTAYRTDFFAREIRRGNWRLELPLMVNGYRLAQNIFQNSATETDTNSSNKTAIDQPKTSIAYDGEKAGVPAEDPSSNTLIKAAEGLDRLEAEINKAVETYDRIDAMTTKVVTREAAARSLWTTIVGTLCQTFWAAVAFVAGVPLEIWLVVAIIAGVLMIVYLYRKKRVSELRSCRVTERSPGDRE